MSSREQLKTRITIILDDELVTKYGSVGFFLERFMKGIFRDSISFEARGNNKVHYIVENDDFDTQRVKKVVISEIARNYSLEEDYVKALVSVEIGAAMPLADVGIEDEVPTRPQNNNTGNNSRDGEPVDNRTPAEIFEDAAPPIVNREESERERKVKELKDEIDNYIGCVEFKRLCEEIIAVAPLVKENKTFETFTHQCYLFSINDGCGFTTYATALARLINTLELRECDEEICEIKLAMPGPDDKNPLESALKSVGRVNNNKKTEVVAIDISEWMDSINKVEFRKFLIELERRIENRMFLFRVPFVDKELLEKIRYTLNDLMFVRTVSVPPLTKEDIQCYANKLIKSFGFKISRFAWEGFHERIAEEKSDGKFYGMNTIRKVIRELIYNKQLTSAKEGVNKLTITKKDTEGICTNGHEIGLSGYELLEKLVAVDSIKESINEIVSQIELARVNAGVERPSIHMRFVGNPGTGKTTIARIIGKILKERGVLRVGNFFEYGGRDFCGKYIGETAPKTASMCRDAYGSVLFIDEAYSLYRGGGSDNRDYGREALDTLIAEMENHRDDIVVIMAGYPDEMETLMKGNPGLASRMPYLIEFPNYTKEQLYDIFVSKIGNIKVSEDLLPAVKKYFLSLPDSLMNSKEFSNARFARNLFERTWSKAALRSQLAKSEEIVLCKDDFDKAASDKSFSFMSKNKVSRIGFVQ